MPEVQIIKIDEVNVELRCSDDIKNIIQRKFTFKVPNSFFMQRNGRRWNGTTSIYKKKTNKFPLGLVPELCTFLKKSLVDYSLHNFKSLTTSIDSTYLEDIKLPSKYTVRDYQYKAFELMCAEGRGVFLLPTASGKSLTMYLYARHLLAHARRVLIIVPRVQLVSQLSADFLEYGMPLDTVQMIMGGYSKYIQYPITISTWQSLQNLPEEWFEQFEAIIGDEAHTFEAKSLNYIMKNLKNAKYRVGVTGTLDDGKIHEMVIKGHFGPIYRIAKTTELMEQEYLAKIEEIKCIKLEYSDADRALAKRMGYDDEKNFVIGHEKRNKFIIKLCNSLKGNTLILFQNISAHGDVLRDLAQEHSNKDVHYIYGSVDVEVRRAIGEILERSSDNDLFASYGTFSTGINIVNINNIIFAGPAGKSKIRILQSIGRGLRKSKTKTKLNIYDIFDDLSPTEKKQNHLLRHSIERCKLYEDEGFNYKIFPVGL